MSHLWNAGFKLVNLGNVKHYDIYENKGIALNSPISANSVKNLSDIYGYFQQELSPYNISCLNW